ncbi:phage tail tape measure protein TP901 family [Clostridium aceticum]|uniref:Phage tail tape measure protein TP901 family n=1 Tax=Clostridium aceticum TaxID=84022 RepID=A0A0G3W9J8_9CLOT|nr:hypothetical protein [Clostridium aceticum]AKL95018.1 phage tail tape measure protein TP901 family [Clostridium aceticum]
MAGRKYEIAFQLGAKVQSSMGNAFGAAQKNINGINKGLRHTENQAGITTRAVSGLSKGLKMLAGAAGAYVGYRAMKAFANESVEAAKAQIEVEEKLEAVLKNVKSLQKEGPEAYKKAQVELLGLASQLQNVGVIGDEVTIAGMQQLATFQMSQKEIGVLSKGMLDLLAQQKGLNASQQDAVGVANMIGKVMDGQVGALSRVGISFTDAQAEAIKFGDQMTRAKVLAEVLEQNVGGVNEALAKTDQGKIQQMTNAWGDMKEEVGKKVLSVQARFAGWFFTKIPRIQGSILGLTDRLTRGIDFIAGGFNKISPHITRLTGNLQQFNPYIDSVTEKFSWLASVGITTFLNIRQAVTNNIPTLERVRDLALVLGDRIKNGLGQAFEAAQPTIEWMFITGLPKTVDVLARVADGAMDVYELISNNWTFIEPIVWGIGVAFGTWKLASLVMETYKFTTALIVATKVKKAHTIATIASTKAKLIDKAETLYLTALYVKDAVVRGASTAATWAQVAATSAWNVVAGIGTVVTKGFGAAIAFATSPIGMIVIAIGVLIAAGVALYKNWDTVGEKSAKIWNGIKDAVRGPANSIIGFANGIIGAYEKMLNGVGSAINKIPSVKIPDWVPGVGGNEFGIPNIPTVSIPKVPMLATGGIAVGPTLAMVGEGSESEAILPLSKLQNLLNTSTVNNSTTNNEQPIHFHYSPQYIIQSDADIEKLRKIDKQNQQDFRRQALDFIENQKRVSIG